MHIVRPRPSIALAPLCAPALLALALVPVARAQQLQPPPPPPPGNPTTPNKALLGKALFWDEQLSSTKTVACATCHIPETGGGDPRSLQTNAAAIHPGPNGVFGDADDVVGSPGVPRSVPEGFYEFHPSFSLGVQVTPRQAPSTINAAYNPVQFWDGRATGAFTDPLTGVQVFPAGASLESQALGPIVSDVEMASLGRSQTDVAARVAASKPLALSPQLSADLVPFVANQTYPQLFQLVFGTPDVTPVRIAEAIAAYERTQFSNQAPIDTNTLTTLENQGRAIFNGPQASCSVCHAGPLLTNQSFQYIGVRPPGDDLGRFNVTLNPADNGRFKVPSLRNVELRPPYFHDGSAATLADVVAFYNRGGDFNAPNKNPLIRPLGLTAQQQQALVAFLGRALTDPRVPLAQAPFDHPQLFSSSTRVPQPFGTPTAGAGGFEPRIVAIEPPIVGNPSFTIGLQGATGGRTAVLAIDTSANFAGRRFRGATSFLTLSSNVLFVRAGTTEGLGDGAGWTSKVLSVPLDPGLIGTKRFAQWFVADTGSANGLFAASDAVEYTFF